MSGFNSENKMKPLIMLFLIFSVMQVHALRPKRVFKKKCLECHSFSGEGTEKGPSLQAIGTKRKSEWLTRYIQSPETLRASGDKEAIKLQKDFSKHPMPAFDHYSEKGIQQLVAYIIAKGAGTDSQIKSGKGDIEAGRYLSTSCTNCHGNLGVTNDSKSPNLAGQNLVYMINQLKAYKSGLREDPKGNMNDLTQSLSERDLVNIATYFSSLKN
jgi:mono/diheme cytochrome c family protein